MEKCYVNPINVSLWILFIFEKIMNYLDTRLAQQLGGKFRVKGRRHGEHRQVLKRKNSLKLETE